MNTRRREAGVSYLQASLNQQRKAVVVEQFSPAEV